VFTCLALFNVLIAPLNAFPWVVNGVVEAFVSLRRIQAYLLLPQRAIEWAYADSILPHIQDFQQQKLQQWHQQQQQAQTDGQVVLPDGKHAKKAQDGSSSSSSSSDGGREKQLQQPLQRTAAAALERGVVAQFDNATFAWKQVRQVTLGFCSCLQPCCNPIQNQAVHAVDSVPGLGSTNCACCSCCKCFMHC
jgi:hypothetical protein